MSRRQSFSILSTNENDETFRHANLLRTIITCIELLNIDELLIYLQLFDLIICNQTVNQVLSKTTTSHKMTSI